MRNKMKMIINEMITKHIWMDGMLTRTQRDEIEKTFLKPRFYALVTITIVFFIICI